MFALALRRAGKYDRCIEETDKLKRLVSYYASLQNETISAAQKSLGNFNEYSSSAEKKDLDGEKRRVTTVPSHSKRVSHISHFFGEEVVPTLQRKVAPTQVAIISSPSAVVSHKSVTRVQRGSQSDRHDSISLAQYKHIFGIPNDVHPTIFEKLNEFQEALLVPPGQRNELELTIIASKLKLFTFLGGLSDMKLHRLASAIEYRLLASKQQIFEQNKDADAMCFLVRGQVQLKMDLPEHMAPLPAIMEYGNESSFGNYYFL